MPRRMKESQEKGEEKEEEEEEEHNEEKGGRKGRPSGLAEFHVASLFASSSRVPFWDEETADKILRFHEWLPVLAHLRREHGNGAGSRH